MAPLMPPGPFNVVTTQTANECFTSVFIPCVTFQGLVRLIASVIMWYYLPVSQGGPGFQLPNMRPTFHVVLFQGHVIVELSSGAAQS